MEVGTEVKQSFNTPGSTRMPKIMAGQTGEATMAGL